MPIDTGARGRGRRIGPSHVNVRVPNRSPGAQGYQQAVRPSNVSVAPRAERRYTQAVHYLSHGLSVPGLSPQIGAILPDVLDAAARYHLDPALLLGQEEQESGFNPGAVSSANAGGISQFIPSTAREYGVQFGTSKKAVRSQIQGQAHYMSDLGAAQNPTEALNRYLGVGGSTPTDYSSNILANQRKYQPVTQAAAKRARAQGIVASMGAPAVKTPGGGTGGGGLTPELAAKQFKGHYVNPYGPPTEVDMGVDYGGTGPIGAIGKGRVVGQSSFGGGPYLAYQLLKGPRKGWTVYVAEGIQPTVRPGQVVKKGQTVAEQTSGIETGWAGSPKVPYQGGAQTLAQATGDPRVAGRHSNFTGTPSESDPVAGRDFLNFLQGKPALPNVGSAAGLSGYIAGAGGSVPVSGGGIATGSRTTAQSASPVPAPPAYPIASRSGVAAAPVMAQGIGDIQGSLAAILGGGASGPPASAVPILQQILDRSRRFRPRR